MAESARRRKLGALLLLYAVAAFAAGALMLFGARTLGVYVIERAVYTPKRVLKMEKALFNEFIGWMNEEGISDFADADAIQPWFTGRRHLIISVYNGGYIFDGSENATLVYSDVKDAAATFELLQREYTDYWYTCPVTVRGDFLRTKVVRVMYFPMYEAERYVSYASLALGFLCFAATLLGLVGRITRYIALLTNELGVMAGGELGHPMTVKGQDELTLLAENMEQMRLSFIERLKREEEMKRASQSLLTDMSHDIRTPLTALIGYLDILEQSERLSPEDRQRYLTAAHRRAWQIKEMTDDLFEYALVYANPDAALVTQRLDGLTLMAQLWDETAFSLESEGFTCECRQAGENAPVDANVKLLKRVFDNIASNARKYADREKPIVAEYGARDGAFWLTVTNAVSPQPSVGESSGIGLKSCEKIAALHGGSFSHTQEGERFVIRFSLPVSAAGEPEQPQTSADDDDPALD